VKEGREFCEECMLKMGEVGELREEPITGNENKDVNEFFELSSREGKLEGEMSMAEWIGSGEG